VYTEWLAAPAVFGCILWIAGLAMQNHDHEVTIPLYSACMSIWAVLFLENWKREQLRVASRWGSVGIIGEEKTRPEFEGEMRVSEITGEEIEYQSVSKLRFRLCCSMLFVFTIMLITIGAIGAILMLKAVLTHKENWEESHAGMLSGACNGIFIIGMNLICDDVAVLLTDYEDHETQTEYDNFLTVKTFVFRFVNSYAALYFIAFVKTSARGTHLEDYVGTCPDDSCLNEMSLQLVSIFFTQIFVGNASELAVPILTNYFTNVLASIDESEEDQKEADAYAEELSAAGEIAQAEEKRLRNHKIEEDLKRLNMEADAKVALETEKETEKEMIEDVKDIPMTEITTRDVPEVDDGGYCCCPTKQTHIVHGKEEAETPVGTGTDPVSSQGHGNGTGLTIDPESPSAKKVIELVKSPSGTLLNIERGRDSHHQIDWNEVEINYRLTPYVVRGTIILNSACCGSGSLRPCSFEDYAELVTQFGYVTLFATAYPLCATLAFLNNILEIRVDAQKLVGSVTGSWFNLGTADYHQRPESRTVEDIGSWFNILEVFVSLAVATNCALVFFASNFCSGHSFGWKITGLCATIVCFDR